MTTRKDKNDVVLNRRDFLSTTTAAGIAIGLSDYARAQAETTAET